MKRKILVIEDNAEMSTLISIFLKNNGFSSLTFDTAEKALDYIKVNPFDLILLDINLPEMDGFDFLTYARKITQQPILIVTARNSDHDVITGLGYGADDYVTKPFSSEILIARIRALLRRSENTETEGPKEISFGSYAFNPQTMSLMKDNQQIDLSVKESRLLDLLIKNDGKPMTPEQIYNEVWKNKFGDLTIVAVYIQRLRRKIEIDASSPMYIKTAFGHGYSFSMPVNTQEK